MKMLSCSDSTLILTIRLQGYEFFSEQFFRRSKRECDVSLHGMKMKIGDDQVTGYILTRGIARNIAEQTSYPLELFSTSPDTIFFSFDKKAIKRMIPLKPGTLTTLPSTDSITRLSDSAHQNDNRKEGKKDTSIKRKGKRL